MIVILNVKMFVSKQYDNELSKHISHGLALWYTAISPYELIKKVM